MQLEYGEFKEKVIGMLAEKLGSGETVGTGTVTKLNGQTLDNVYIAKEGQEIYPTRYLEHLYEIYEEGVPLETIASMIRDMSTESGPDEEMCLKLSNYEKAKDHICVKLVNTERNRELLAGIPHIDFLDLSVVFYVLFTDGSDQYQTMVSDDLLESWSVTKQDILKMACQNTKRLNPLRTDGLLDLLEKLSAGIEPMPGPDPGITVISSQYGCCGAIYMLDKTLLAYHAERCNDDLLIIPSSIHEVMLLPASTADREELDRTVKAVNESMLAPGEYLSDHTYLFLKDEGKIII